MRRGEKEEARVQPPGAVVTLCPSAQTPGRYYGCLPAVGRPEGTVVGMAVGRGVASTVGRGVGLVVGCGVGALPSP